MEFFHGQEALTAMQWILRAIVAFFFLLFAAKIMGQRSISQLRLLDFVMAISIGNIIAHPLSDEGLGMKGSMITMTVLVVLYLLGVFMSLNWISFRHFIDPSPLTLIKDGQIISKNLKKARISVDLLLSELRKEQIEDVQKVALALWEPDGSISSFLYPLHQTLTQTDMKLAPTPFSFPSVIIKEGKIDYDEVKNININVDWLKNEITSAYDADISDVLLATIDSNKNLQVFLYT
ncbi:membrane protein [Lysinibacillus contaminans]|uniref:Membrane protein n=1 Tax=Lysinibacillus contaminans TaxID=1293441 RepID=A0ABR5K534_9BACI|nr:YetF domain-containing protein [Lysinibacillus contaminans]KOS71512.1 membrane protein [Lysinibacillus contaminans]